MNFSSLAELIKKLTGIFDLFDLSFLISGSVAVLAWSWLLWAAGVGFPDSTVVMLVLWSVGAYINGLICFSLGRRIRLRLWKRPDLTDELTRQVSRHKLLAREFASYMAGVDPASGWGLQSLYGRMWAELRERAGGAAPELQPSYRLIRGHWVRTATFDGMIAALLLIFVVANVAVPLVGEGVQALPFPALSLTGDDDARVSIASQADRLQGAIDGIEAAQRALREEVEGVGGEREQLTVRLEALHEAAHTLALATEAAELEGAADSALEEAVQELAAYQELIRGEDGLEVAARSVKGSVDSAAEALRQTDEAATALTEAAEALHSQVQTLWGQLPWESRLLITSPMLIGIVFCGWEARASHGEQLYEIINTLIWDREQRAAAAQQAEELAALNAGITAALSAAEQTIGAAAAARRESDLALRRQSQAELVRLHIAQQIPALALELRDRAERAALLAEHPARAEALDALSDSQQAAALAAARAGAGDALRAAAFAEAAAMLSMAAHQVLDAMDDDTPLEEQLAELEVSDTEPSAALLVLARRRGFNLPALDALLEPTEA